MPENWAAYCVFLPRSIASKKVFRNFASESRSLSHCIDTYAAFSSQAKRIREQSFEHEALVYGPGLRLGWPYVTLICLRYNRGS